MDKALHYLCKGWKHSIKFKAIISIWIGAIIYYTFDLIAEPYVSSDKVIGYLIYMPLFIVMGGGMISEFVTFDPIVMDKINNE